MCNKTNDIVLEDTIETPLLSSFDEDDDDDNEADHRNNNNNNNNNHETNEDETNRQSAAVTAISRLWMSGVWFCRGCTAPCRWIGNRFMSSLSMSETTPRLATILIPVLAITTQYIFYVGQTAPMWRLVLSGHVAISVNATSFEAKTAFRTLGLDPIQYYATDQDHTVRTFTYAFAIQELWKAAHMPGSIVLPRTAAVLLVIFSGVWPHLKLILLTITWLFVVNSSSSSSSNNNNNRRTKILRWLSILGKWSLADVLVVCVMVGVLNLDWNVSPAEIKNGIVQELPLLLGIVKNLYSATDLCSYFLKKGCKDPHKVDTWSKCTSCKNLVNSIMNHPDTARNTVEGIANGVEQSGGGLVTMRVMGMRGIYAFCAAVIMSIALSLAVDVFDVRAKRHAELVEAMAALEAQGDDIDDDDEEEGIHMLPNGRQLEEQGVSTNRFNDDETSTSTWLASCKDQLMVALSIFTAVLAFTAVTTSVIERRVTGAIPKLLSEVLGVNLDRSFSLRTLSRTTGAAGGWDLLLMATFSLFVVSGPVLRSVLAFVALALPKRSPSIHRTRFFTSIAFLGAFCAWEVFILATIMVDLLMPSITSTVIMKPQCAQVVEDGTCLKVAFYPNSHFALVIIGGVLLVFVAQLPWLKLTCR